MPEVKELEDDHRHRHTEYRLEVSLLRPLFRLEEEPQEGEEEITRQGVTRADKCSNLNLAMER